MLLRLFQNVNKHTNISMVFFYIFYHAVIEIESLRMVEDLYMNCSLMRFFD